MPKSVKYCTDCFLKGFNIWLGYILCLGVIVLCLSVGYGQKESFAPFRKRKNRLQRRLRRWRRPYIKKLQLLAHRLRRRLF